MTEASPWRRLDRTAEPGAAATGGASFTEAAAGERSDLLNLLLANDGAAAAESAVGVLPVRRVSLGRMIEIQSESMADDVPIFDEGKMGWWSEEQLRDYFESGGARKPPLEEMDTRPPMAVGTPAGALAGTSAAVAISAAPSAASGPAPDPAMPSDSPAARSSPSPTIGELELLASPATIAARALDSADDTLPAPAKPSVAPSSAVASSTSDPAASASVGIELPLAGPPLWSLIYVDGDTSTPWRTDSSQLPDGHIISVTRGPVSEAVDAVGSFRASFGRTELPMEELRRRLATPPPPFRLLSIRDLVPSASARGLRRDYRGAAQRPAALRPARSPAVYAGRASAASTQE